MSSLNKATLIGRLGADPDVRYTQNNTAVANLSVATSERYKDGNGEYQERTEWHRVVAWGRLAEVCREYLKKGSLAYFEGPLQTRKWQDRDGQDRYTTEIKALSMQMLDTRNSGDPNENQPGPGPAATNQTQQGAAPPAKPGDIEDVEDELPF